MANGWTRCGEYEGFHASMDGGMRGALARPSTSRGGTSVRKVNECEDETSQVKRMTNLRARRACRGRRVVSWLPAHGVHELFFHDEGWLGREQERDRGKIATPRGKECGHARQGFKTKTSVAPP